MLAAMSIALATQPVAMSPKTPWLVDGEEDLCFLQRDYGVDKKQLTLVFKPLLDLDTMELYVLTTDRSATQASGAATVTLSPGDRTFGGTYFSVVAPGKNLRYTRLTVSRDVLTSLKDGDVMRVDAKPIDFAFAIIRPEKALPALKACVDSLEKSWGVDPESKAAVATKLQGNPGRYFGPDAYPTEAVRQGIYGRVVVLLQVDVRGRVAGCRVVSSAGKVLNEGTCTAAQRIQFTPALNKDGQPIASTYLLPVHWVLPGADDPTPRGSRDHAALKADLDRDRAKP